MVVEHALIIAIAVSGCLLWIVLAAAYRRMLSAVWMLSAVLFLREIKIFISDAIGVEIPAVMLAVVAAVVVAAPVAARSTRQIRRALREPIVVLWIALLLYGAASLMWSPNRQYGAAKFLLALAIGVIPGLAMYIAYRYRQRMSWNSFLFCGVAYSVLVLVNGDVIAGRLAGEGGNPIWAARSALFVAAVAIWDGRSWAPVRLVAVIMSFWVAIATQSRGPLLAFLAAALIVCAVMWVRTTRVRYRRTSIVLVCAGVAVILGVVAIDPQVPSNVIGSESRFASLAHSSSIQDDSNVAARIALQRQAIDLFLQHPVLGAGLGSSAPPGEQSHPHNVPLEMASELGVLGALMWLAAVAGGLYAARRNWLVQLLLVQALLYSLTSGDLASNNLVLVLSIFASALQEARGPQSSQEGSVIYGAGTESLAAPV